MKKLILALCCLVVLQAAAQKKHRPVPIDYTQRLKGLDTAFNHILRNWHAPGFAVAVIEKNRVIYTKGVGYRDIEHKLPVTPNTLFAIGSCTKAFTASLLGMLQKEGKVDLDKPVNSYMPALRFYNDAMNNSITLRDMMSHRTGLPRHDFSWYLFNTSSRDSLIQRIQYMEPAYPVRQTWRYNNFMFMAQGAIIEKLTNKSWDENIQEKIFTPLGMTSSNTNIAALQQSTEAATGYEVYQDSIIRRMDYYNINGMSPAGAINSSVTDMAKWVSVWINEGKLNGKEFIPANYYSQAISSQMVISGSVPTRENPDIYFSNYGLGWFLTSYRGHYMVEHGGNIDGFSASTCFFPSDSVGIVVLTNQNGSPVPSLVRNLIADRLFKLPYKDWNGRAKHEHDKDLAAEKKNEKETKVKARHFPATHPLADYAGSYSNPGYGTFKISVRHDSLFSNTGSYTMWLRHQTYDVVDVIPVNKHYGIDTTGSLVKMQFHMNDAGEIESISGLLEAGIKPIVFTKGLEAKAVTEKELSKYIGDYALSSITAKVYTKANNVLYLLVPGQPEYELVPLGNDKFGIKNLTGYSLQFDVDSNSKVTDVVFMQPNGNYKAPKK